MAFTESNNTKPMRCFLSLMCMYVLSLNSFGQYFECQELKSYDVGVQPDSIDHIDAFDCPELLSMSLLSKTLSLRIAAKDLISFDLCGAARLKDLYLEGTLEVVPECVENLVVLNVNLDNDGAALFRKRFDKLEHMSLAVNEPVILDSLVANLDNFPVLWSFWLHDYTGDLHRVSSIWSLDRVKQLSLVTDSGYRVLPDNFASESIQTMTISMDYDYATKIDWKTRFPNLEDITIYTSRVENFRDGFENLAGVESIKIGVNLNLNLEDDLKIWDDLQRDVWYLRAEYDVDVVLSLAR
ncbi:hypothetical protein [Phaeocystidibacter luteus]|uniref:Uncharacterized protein n=1 Tax=Phaeocystidibacter luteus TaxID=911197 RepID=A0A6N6RE63_9FLAO|nr:hypothetical protein [Phaeocystidibacter luteus]KAB2807675.1 hypothetical protein F8C67_11585 [Phaeocystidibacter luteus]